jgi:demethylsterigmatocystin 6-O-methyltransferase
MQQLQITGARIAIDLGIFEAINESESPLNVVQLAAKTGAAPELLGKNRNIAPHQLGN